MRKVPVEVTLKCGHVNSYRNHIPRVGDHVTCIRCSDARVVINVLAWRAVCQICHYVKIEGDRGSAFNAGWEHAEKKGHLVDIVDPLTTSLAVVMPSTAPLIPYSQYGTIKKDAH